MTDHLPECPVYGHTLIDPGGMSWLPERKKSRIREANARACICPELRACEQRVREEYESQDCYTLGFSHGIAEGVPKALDAAREAVAASWTGWCPDPTTCTDYEHVCGERRNVLAAIDALKKNNET